MTLLQHPYTVTLARWILAVLFIVAATGKILDRRRFHQTVLSYQVLPARFARSYAVVVPWIEGVVGVLLLLGLLSKIAAFVSALLLITFIIAIGINVARGRTDLDCGCLSTQHHQKIGSSLIFRNIIFLGLSFHIFLFENNGFFPIIYLLGLKITYAVHLSVESLLQITFTCAGIMLIYFVLQKYDALNKD